MSILGALFLVLLLYFLWGIIKLAWRVHRVRKQSAEMFAQMFGGAASGSAGADMRDRSRAGRGAAPRRAKRFGKDVGEYVKFDEIKVEGTSRQTMSDTAASDMRIDTSRIEDAEWEEVK